MRAPRTWDRCPRPWSVRAIFRALLWRLPRTPPTTSHSPTRLLVGSNRFSVNGPKLLSPIPLPTFSGPGGNYTVSAANRSDTREDLIRIDYYINSKNRSEERRV